MKREASNFAAIHELRAEIAGRSKPQTPQQPDTSKGVEDLIVALNSAKMAEELKRAAGVGSNFDVARLVRAIQTQLRSDARLAAAEPKSVIAAAMECAELNLRPGNMGHIFIVTRAKENPDTGTGCLYEAHAVTGYRGLISLAMRSGLVKSVTSRIVTERELEEERFELYYEGERDVLVHRPIFEMDAGEPVLVYCLVRFNDGTFHVEPMHKSEIERIKDNALRATATYGEGDASSAWITNEMEMWRKTPIRRALKYLDVCTDALERAALLDEKLIASMAKTDERPSAEAVIARLTGRSASNEQRLEVVGTSIDEQEDTTLLPVQTGGLDDDSPAAGADTTSK